MKLKANQPENFTTIASTLPRGAAVTVAVWLLLAGAAATHSFAQSAAQAVKPAAVYTKIHSFCAQSNCTDGSVPYNHLVQGLEGNLYGTAGGGITNTVCPRGCGMVFKMTPQGAVAPIYNFCSQSNCADGETPTSLILGNDGSFYGVTEAGGLPSNNTSNCPQGCGTIFKLTAQGTLTTLYSFDPNVGYYGAQIMQGSDGNFYGKSFSDLFSNVSEILFKMTPKGSVTTLTTVGEEEVFLAFQGTDGSIYGASTPVCNQYCQAQGGTLLTLTPEGAMATVFNFCPSESNCTNGASPDSLFQGADGSFYGTTFEGGNINNLYSDQCDYGCGTAFKVTPSGTLTTLYDFCQQTNCVDGAFPNSLVQATDGNFYGSTAELGGVHDGGTLFELSPAGNLTTLYNFCAVHSCGDGVFPSGLIQATNGGFYGTTTQGGAYAQGVAFSLSVGLGPFVRTLPGYGAVGAKIKILGNNLKNTTAVRFNGAAAAFTVNSNTYITATVPAGATSGTVTVTTPSGTLSTNVSFVLR